MKIKPLRLALICLVVVLVLVFVYSATRVFGTVHQYNESSRYYEQQRKTAVVTEGEGQTLKPSAAPTQTQETEHSPVTVDFELLRETAKDIRGWIYAEGTKIDYPVVQGTDNDFYLYRLTDGTRNPGGSIFLDFRCEPDFSGRNTIIYGHHMMDGSMFCSLVDYSKQSYYDEHPVMYLNTPEGDYRLEIFAGFTTGSDSGVYTIDFYSRTEFADWAAEMASYSDFTSSVTVGLDDRVVTLSTCTYEYNNSRYVVLAKLVPLA